MSLVLESRVGGDFKPHVEGIHPAICVDVIDLGLEETDFQGQHRVVNKVRLSFETEQKNEDGKNFIISKKFTASLTRKPSWRSSWGNGAVGLCCRARASTWQSSLEPAARW